jgi:hypothetical protein
VEVTRSPLKTGIGPRGMWEIAHDRSTYEKDFDVVYRKAL